MTEEQKKTEAAPEVAPKKEEAKVETAPAAAPTAPKMEVKAEAPASAEETEEVEIPAKFKKIVEDIGEMSVLDLNELVKIFEKKFGVSATAVAAVPGATAAGGDEESDSVNVELTDAGANKIAVIKAVKDALALGLKEAKDMVDGVPTMLKTDAKKEEAEDLKKKIEEAGGKVTFK